MVGFLGFSCLYKKRNSCVFAWQWHFPLQWIKLSVTFLSTAELYKSPFNSTGQPTALINYSNLNRKAKRHSGFHDSIIQYFESGILLYIRWRYITLTPKWPFTSNNRLLALSKICLHTTVHVWSVQAFLLEMLFQKFCKFDPSWPLTSHKKLLTCCTQ